MSNFVEEFKIYETMFDDIEESQTLKEWRTAADVQAATSKTNQAQTQAMSKNSVNDNDAKVYIWDMYMDPAEKGTWTSAELYKGSWDGYVYESEDKAYNGGWELLLELEDEGELRYDVDDYVIDTKEIPLSEISDDVLRFSNLTHLI